MASNGFLRVHRNWEDWTGIGLGFLVALSPWIARQDGDPYATGASVVIGLAVLVLAEIGLVKFARPAEYGQLACGGALAACPVVLGYAGEGELRYWHFAFGALVALLALLQLRQRHSPDDPALAAHADS